MRAASDRGPLRGQRPGGVRGLVLLGALALAGCTVEATGFRVTVQTMGAAIDRLDVRVVKSGSRIGTGSYTGTVADGASFGVQLADSLDGQVVTIEIDASRAGTKVATGSNGTTVVKRMAVPLTVSLFSSIDGGIDAGLDLSMRDMVMLPDLTVIDEATPTDLTGEDLSLEPDLSGMVMPDLAGLDGALPDLSMVDMIPSPDLYVPPDLACDPTCINGVYSYCDGNNKRVSVPCGFGCNGPQCAGPNSCMAAGDISNAGTYNATTLGSKPTAVGSCQAVGGPDNTLKFTTKTWSKVTLTANATYTAAFWVRGACADPPPFTEYVANGLCAQAALGPACLAGNMNQTLTLCGLPPGVTSYAFVEHPAGVGGMYSITSTFTPQNLNVCAEAGMLPGNAFSFATGDTTPQLPRNQAPPGPMGSACNQGDSGAASPEMVFWVPIGANDAGKTLTVTVTGLNGFSPFLYTQTYCQPASTLCFTTVNNVATAKFVQLPKDTALFFFVDGLNGAKGQFKLDMTLK